MTWNSFCAQWHHSTVCARLLMLCLIKMTLDSNPTSFSASTPDSLLIFWFTTPCFLTFLLFSTHCYQPAKESMLAVLLFGVWGILYRHLMFGVFERLYLCRVDTDILSCGQDKQRESIPFRGISVRMSTHWPHNSNIGKYTCRCGKLWNALYFLLKISKETTIYA